MHERLGTDTCTEKINSKDRTLTLRMLVIWIIFR